MIQAYQIKIDRAKTHIDHLETEVRSFLEAEPYEISARENSESGDLIYYLSRVRDTPIEWSAIVGDAIHNLRSSLDLIACELVHAAGGQVTTSTGFPFAQNEANFKSVLFNKLNGATKAAIRAVREIAPYPSGNQQLWQIQHLNNADKHYLLLTVGSAHEAVVIDFGKWTRFMNDFVKRTGAEIDDAVMKGLEELEELSLPLGIRPADRQWPLTVGDELFIVRAGVRDTPISVPSSFGFEIAFGDGPIVAGLSLIQTLREYVQVVESVVTKLSPFL